MENYVGKRLDGRYEVQEIIGVGGMSVVYKAYDNVDDRIVAIKILKEEYANDDDFVRRFKNESKAIAVLSHPNIVKVYDVSFGEKIQYIVMEHVDGITLKEYIQKQGVITWNDAVFFATQILKALQHAHDKGIVHRDIKPQNIILLQTGDIKVTDFGIARFSRTETKTLTENAIGSVHYISPEQAKGEFTDERADIYSLGVVLYEMLSGRVPFEADSAVSVALMQLQKEPKRLTSINSNIPLGIEQICVHAMQKNPSARYQTATEMLLDLEEVIRNSRATFDYTYFVDKEPTKYIFREDAAQHTDSSEPEEDAYYEEQYADPNNKKKIITACIVGIILLVAAVTGLIMFMTQGVNTDTHTLESFVGMSYDQLASSKDFDYEFVAEYQESSEYEEGIVISQSPEAGEKVISGTTITLYVSKSNNDLKVPNLYNLTTEKAKRALELNNLKSYKFLTISSETVEEGSVVYTDPKAESVVSFDTEILIYVSSGPSTTKIESYRVPDVVGLSQNDAKAFLQRAGFTNIVVETRDTATRKGIVLEQSPSYNTTARSDEKIKIVVSTGVTTTEAPADYTITLNITLPVCVDPSGVNPKEKLIVYVNGEQYTAKSNLALDGSKTAVAISAKSSTEISVTVVLDNIGASQNFKINVNQDKTKDVDFSEYSDKNQE